MKSFPTLCLLFVFSGFSGLLPSAQAILEPGEKAAPIQTKTWRYGDPVQLPSPIKAPNGKDDSKLPRPAEHMLILFWGSWAGGSSEAMDIIGLMQKKYPGLKAVAISRESKAVLEKFISGRNGSPCSQAIDEDDQMFKAYMGNDIIIPHVFVVNADKIILWTGEPIDLPDYLATLFSGKFDLDREKKLTSLYKKLRLALQTGNLDNVLSASEELLRKDKRCGAALRTGLFVFETRNQPEEAVSFIAGMLRRDQEWFRLHMLKLELELRAGHNAGQLEKSLRTAFRQFDRDVESLNGLSWFILDRMPFRLLPPPLLADITSAALRNLKPTDDPALRASCYEAYARMLMLSGRTAEAEAWQRQAIAALPEKSAARSSADEIRKIYAALLKQRQVPPGIPLPGTAGQGK